jgi:hypothetical protein
MYNITHHFITHTREYQHAIDYAIDSMFFHDTNSRYEIIDDDTGELLFDYKNGNVEYIKGSFAQNIINAFILKSGTSKAMKTLKFTPKE